MFFKIKIKFLLIKSIRIQKKASNSGFTFNSTYESKAKVYEELEELNEEIKLNNLEKIESEYGDFLFSIINYGNSLGLNPDNALEKANKKFINRFKKMEINLKKDNLIIDQISKKILLKYWQKSK